VNGVWELVGVASCKAHMLPDSHDDRALPNTLDISKAMQLQNQSGCFSEQNNLDIF